MIGDLLRLVELLRADADPAAVLAVADRVEADARDMPSPLTEAGACLARAAVAAAATSDRQVWDRLRLASTAWRIAATARRVTPPNPTGALE